MPSSSIASNARLPPSAEPYDPSTSMVGWLETQRALHGDIFMASVYGSEVYVISDPDYVQHVLRRNWQNYQKKGLATRRVTLLLGSGLISSEGALWKKQRRMIQPAFQPKVIAGLKQLIIDTNLALIQKWEQSAQNNERVNITRDISEMILHFVLASIFGEDYPQVAPEFRGLTEESARDLQFAQTFRPLRRVVHQIALQRRAEARTGADFLGMLMDAKDRDSGQGMTDDQLATEIMTLIVAGHETTSLTLCWIWYLLSKHPQAAETVLIEADRLDENGLPDFAAMPQAGYLGQVVDEALRLYPPVWLITRKALGDDYLGDYFVPARTEIYFSPYIIHRHPDLWDAPDMFDPDRFSPARTRLRHSLAAHAFSAGARNCIGEALARFEMMIHLIMIARRFRLRAVGDQPLDLDFGVNLRNKYDFIMIPQIRAS
jgi:cytochrome P450